MAALWATRVDAARADRARAGHHRWPRPGCWPSTRLFALGETLLQPTIPAITNDLAPDHLRGRYNAVNAGAFQAGTILGPVVAGFMLDHQWSTAFVVMIVVGLRVRWRCSPGSVERRITPEVNGVQDGSVALTEPTGAGPGDGVATGPQPARVGTRTD